MCGNEQIVVERSEAPLAYGRSTQAGIRPKSLEITHSIKHTRIICGVPRGVYKPALCMNGQQSAFHTDLKAGAMKGFPNLGHSRARGRRQIANVVPGAVITLSDSWVGISLSRQPQSWCYEEVSWFMEQPMFFAERGGEGRISATRDGHVTNRP